MVWCGVVVVGREVLTAYARRWEKRSTEHSNGGLLTHHVSIRKEEIISKIAVFVQTRTCKVGIEAAYDKVWSFFSFLFYFYFCFSFSRGEVKVEKSCV